MVEKLFVAGGALAAWPMIAEAHPIRAHLKDGWILEEADEKLSGEDWRPIFLNTQQNEELSALAEAIVPGAMKAQANRFIDLLLSVDRVDNQKKFVAALAAMEEESQKEFGKGFAKLDTAQQTTVLTKASTLVEGSEASADWDEDDEGENIAGPRKEKVASVHLFDHFQCVKGWVSGAYYTSEMGMKELGWTENRMFATFPGCEHAGGHS